MSSKRPRRPAQYRRAPTSRLLIPRALGVRCRVVLYPRELQSALRQRSSRLMVDSTLRAVAVTVSAKRPVRRCAVCGEAVPRFSRPRPAPRGDAISARGVSCLWRPPPLHVEQKDCQSLGTAEPLPLFVCAHPYCPTRGSWRRRLSPAAARASCSSLSILLLLKPRPKTADTGRQRVAL